MVAYQRRRPKPRGQPPRPGPGKPPEPGGEPPAGSEAERQKDDLQRGVERHEKHPGREDYGR